MTRMERKSMADPRPIITCAILLALPAAASAQTCANRRPNGYCPETTPRAGERRLNQFSYKASHNSFQRSEDMDYQLDDYNVWMVELDLHYRGDTLKVVHHCFDLAGEQSFAEAVEEIASSATAEGKVTFIYLQQNSGTSGENFCFSGWPTRAEYFADVENELKGWIPAEWFYTHDDFKIVDSRRWPSVEELVRRDQHFVVMFQERDENGSGASYSEDFFFGVSTANPPSDCCNFAMSSISGGCDGDLSTDPDPVASNPQIPAGTEADRWLHRIYPSGACASECDRHKDEYWDNGLARGYNFIATNCVNNTETLDPANGSYDFRTPMPLYVTVSSTGQNQWGTIGFPYYLGSGLSQAIGWSASPSVPILIWPGTYDVTTGGPRTMCAAGSFCQGGELKPWGPPGSIVTIH